MSPAPGSGGDANAARLNEDAGLAAAGPSSPSPSGQDLLQRGSLEAHSEQVSSAAPAEASSSRMAKASPPPPATPSARGSSGSMPSPLSLAASSSSRSPSSTSIIPGAKQQRRPSRVEALSPLSNMSNFQRFPSSSSSSSSAPAAAQMPSGSGITLVDPLEVLRPAENTANLSSDDGRQEKDGESYNERISGSIAV